MPKRSRSWRRRGGYPESLLPSIAQRLHLSPTDARIASVVRGYHSFGRYQRRRQPYGQQPYFSVHGLSRSVVLGGFRSSNRRAPRPAPFFFPTSSNRWNFLLGRPSWEKQHVPGSRIFAKSESSGGFCDLAYRDLAEVAHDIESNRPIAAASNPSQRRRYIQTR